MIEFIKNKKIILILIILFGFFGVVGNSEAANIYVDQTLLADCTSGDYSTTNRDCSGSDGDAYVTIQEAVDAMIGGDDIYLRGGIYSISGSTIIIPAVADGTSENWSSIQSYPREWAILDGENNISDSNGTLIGFTAHGGDGPRAYWKFERLEIKNAGNSDASAAIFMNYGPIIVRYCYIHNCTCDRAGLANAGAIKGKAWHDSIIEYNYFHDNGGTTDNYGSDICIYSDYVVDPADVNIDYATHNNTIRYNYFLNSQQAIKYKNFQSLSLDNSGTHTTYNDYGDNIHHNILVNAVRDQHYSQDFIQIHNNIFDNCGIIRTQEVYDDPRERFYSTVYNNSFIQTRLEISRNDYEGVASNYIPGTTYPDLHPHAYVYNNIFENVMGVVDGRNVLTFMYINNNNDGTDWEALMNWNTMITENNLFYGYSSTENVFKVYHTDYSNYGFTSKEYASLNYTTESTGLHPVGEKYLVDPDFVVGGTTKISDGGIGGPHPYLSGVTIPSYIGATNPNDNAWVDGVLALDSTYMTSVTGGTDPDWIEGSGAQSDTTPPSHPMGLGVI